MQSRTFYNNDDHHPRLIIWKLAGEDHSNHNGFAANVLNGQECILVMESIARLSKPILVLTGSDVLRRSDLHDIVSYGQALGLKIIVEAQPDQLNDEILRKFRSFGPRIFRVMVDGAVLEDMNSRYKQSEEFVALEQTVTRLREAGFEIHFGATVRNHNLRELSYEVDYAVRRGARGLYCHLCFNNPKNKQHEAQLPITSDEYIAKIAEIKSYLPKQMYFSPQCAKFGLAQHEEDGDNRRFSSIEWKHWCLGGKTFAFINPEGKVQICDGIGLEVGDLRAFQFNFGRLWEQSAIFEHLRNRTLSCDEMQIEIRSDDVASQHSHDRHNGTNGAGNRDSILEQKEHHAETTDPQQTET